MLVVHNNPAHRTCFRMARFQPRRNFVLLSSMKSTTGLSV
jgi:hypothetical protein